MPRRVILDCDTGTDDAIAIMVAALHPQLELVAVTTVWGNADVRVTTENTLRVLRHIGRSDIPVHAGLGGPSERGAPVQPAVEWLVETLRAPTDRVTLVATGPLTNLAAALAAEPRIVDAVDELVVMGGSHAIPGVTPSAERNFWNDPAAASAVLAAGFERLVLVPLDATYAAALTAGDCARLRDLGTPAATAAAAFIAERIRDYRDVAAFGDRQAAPVHDPLTIAYLVAPEVVSFTPARVEVETRDPRTVGRTVMDFGALTADPPNALVALDADATAFRDVLESTLGAGGATPPRAARPGGASPSGSCGG